MPQKNMVYELKVIVCVENHGEFDPKYMTEMVAAALSAMVGDRVLMKEGDRTTVIPAAMVVFTDEREHRPDDQSAPQHCPPTTVQ